MASRGIKRVLVGNFIHSISLSEAQILRDHVIGIADNGTIQFFEKASKLEDLRKNWNFSDEVVHNIPAPRFVIPGFVDTHIHAPQYSYTGTGYDLPLLDWLNTYTFPAESKLSDQNIAKQVYGDVVKRTLSLGTTTATYFATIDLEATKTLVNIMYDIGQRGWVGKVNMDRNSPTYFEKTEDSLNDTKAFIDWSEARWEELTHNPTIPAPARVWPIITPRFAPTCTDELLSGLSKLAKDHNLLIQSHVSENKQECAWIQELYPSIPSYGQVYEHFGLLQKNTIMAHGIYLSDEELDLFRSRDAGISHCPVSNFAITSGVFSIRNALAKGVKVGLGTDVSGGYSPSMLEVIRQAIIASKVHYFQALDSNESAGIPEGYVPPPLTFHEAFYLATVGGAQLLGMEDKIGNFEIGKYFDAIVVNPASSDSPFNNYDFVANNLEDHFQKFVFLGDDRNIEKVYVNGEIKLSKLNTE